MPSSRSSLCAHRDRVEKLTVIRQEVNEMILEPIHSLDGGRLPRHPRRRAGRTPGRPSSSSSSQAEEDTARYHEDFVATADDVLAASARAFKQGGQAGPRGGRRAARACWQARRQAAFAWRE